METKEYFEKVMQDYNQHRTGRSLRKYCKDEGVDYAWLIAYKKNYPPRKEEAVSEAPGFIPLSLEEEKPEPPVWRVAQLVLSSPAGDLIEIKSNNLLVAAELLRKMSRP
ncbi:hypothetical protein [Parabacteroides sp. ZJ-118]|uniref:IS66 family insertion sequence element accessory protein TnpA n=1 Tax=Parabacteroides sp. ZJ-118 TaxID=2709398 RepID=UPI0013EE2B5A|nr:hypothetical protein [Parabacteroides sp. ZJ-118]